MSELAWNEQVEPITRTIDESTESALEFNVMPDRPVRETLHIKRYRIGHRFIEAQFDRTYVSSMLKSPSHLIFLTALVHTQKILYVYACHELGLEYDPYGPEVLKIWPTQVEIQMPRMVRNESDLTHTVHIDSFERLAEGRHHIVMRSEINGCIYINGETPVYVL